MADENLSEQLVKAAGALQSRLAMVDFWSRPSDPNSIQLIVMTCEELTIRMDANRNHGRAHVHIDYGRNFHAASFAIDTGVRLVGRKTPYDKEITQWILENQVDLNQTWDDLRSAGANDTVVARLKGTGFG